MRKILLLLISTLGLWSCEEEITNYKVTNPNTSIVVYGEISNLEKPYTVRITNVNSYNPYDISEFKGKPVEDANVKIIDGLKNEIVLVEISPGLYQTNGLSKGITNQTYQLKIKTRDGIEIESTTDKLKNAPVINQFDYQFVDATKVENMRFDIKTSIKDPANSEDYYYLKKQDFIQFQTTCTDPPPPPAPPPPCYFKCWRAPLNTQPILVNDFLVNGKNIPIQMNPVDALDWTDWVIQLDAYSVSKEIYNYWKRQEDQRTIGGGLFDKIPAQIVGNLKCTNNSSQEVLGVFVVAGILKQRLTINRFDALTKDQFVRIERNADFINYRYKEFKVLDCRTAGWIDYNIGLEIPSL